jgi:hypothetical protein
MRSAKVNVGDSGLASQYNNLRSDAYASSQLLPHQQTSPNMTLYVEAGVYWIAGMRISFAGGNSPTFSAPGSNNIIDLLVIDNTGTLSIVVGTSGVSPAVPTYPKDKIVIAEVYIRTASSSLKDTDDTTNGYIYNDVRPFLNNGKYISQTGAETYAVDSGAANAYVANFTPAFAALVDGMEVSFRASNANTGASTLNVNSLGALTIYKNKNVALASGDILLNQTVTVVYDSVDNCWQMQSPVANTIAAINIFGDASDGDVNINSGSFSSGPISSNGLTRDAFFNSLTLSGGNLSTNGYRLFVRGVLTRQSTYQIYWNGNAGSSGNNGGDANTGSGAGSGGTGGNGGGALSDGTLKGSPAGGNGATGGGAGGNNSAGGSGSNATNSSKSNCIGNAAVAGGNGASGNSAMSPVGIGGGSGGSSSAGTTTPASMKPHIPTLAALMADWAAGVLTPLQNSTAGSGGGGAGGGGGFSTSYSPWYYGATGGGGGGAGSNSGTFFIAASSIVDSGSGTMFQFKGGAGGNGGNGGSCGGNNSSPNGGAGGGGGGGAGGNGGSGVLMYVKKTGTCTFDQSGGTGGTGGNGGAGSSGGSYPHPAGTNGGNGTNGASGVLYEFNLQA